MIFYVDRAGNTHKRLPFLPIKKESPVEKYGWVFWREVAMCVIALALLIGVTIVDVPVEVLQ